MNPRRDSLLRYTAPDGHRTGILAVLSNQAMLGGQLVAVYSDADVAALLDNAQCPAPARVAFVDFHEASPDHYRRIGRLPDAATRVLGQFSPGVPAIRTKVLLEPVDQVGRGSGRYLFDASWTTASIMARVESGELSLVPVWSDSVLDDPDLGADESDALRSMQAEHQTAVAQGHYYIAVTPHDEPFTMLEVLPASKASVLSGIHEVPHESIRVDLIWER
jgi:hypothetical protein